MKPEIAEKWTTALRSGKYRQGKRFLQKDGEFCAIGVLYDLYRKECKPSGSKKSFWDNIEFRDVRKWAGLNGYFEYGDKRFIAAENDRGADFNLIANIIEEHAKEL